MSPITNSEGSSMGSTTKSTKSICVIVDFTSENEKNAGRYNYWKKRLRKYRKNYEWRFISLEEYRRNNIIFNFDDFNIVIISTDTANADFVFHSHIGWLYFHHHGKIRKDLWFRKGIEPRLIVEHQGIRLVPMQSSYDAILGPNEVKVSEFEPEIAGLSGNTCNVVNKFKDHPIIKAIDKRDRLCSDLKETNVRPFFGKPYPRWLGREGHYESTFDEVKHALYGGWFTKWGKGWIPLLQSASNKYAPTNHAILLVKVISEKDRKGILIATTMKLATATPEELLEGVIDADFKSIADYHHKISKRHCNQAIIFTSFMILSLFATSFLLLRGWTEFITSSQNPTINILKDAIGLPLIGLWILHWKAFKRFVGRSYHTQYSRKRILQALRKKNKSAPKNMVF